jgi:hypothetical protein
MTSTNQLPRHCHWRVWRSLSQLQRFEFLVGPRMESRAFPAEKETCGQHPRTNPKNALTTAIYLAVKETMTAGGLRCPRILSSWANVSHPRPTRSSCFRASPLIQCNRHLREFNRMTTHRWAARHGGARVLYRRVREPVAH